MSDLFECPHCSHKNDTTDWTENFNHDGDTFEVECHECENEFSVTPRIEVTYWPPATMKRNTNNGSK